MKSLIRTWSLPERTHELKQLTLRLDFDSYARLHALKEIYKSRSVNDMIKDILKTGLDEIVEALPTRKMTHEEAEECAYSEQGHVADYEGCLTGPGREFEYAYRRILESKADVETKEENA
jgi:hypothetical protein